MTRLVLDRLRLRGDEGDSADDQWAATPNVRIPEIHLIIPPPKWTPATTLCAPCGTTRH